MFPPGELCGLIPSWRYITNNQRPEKFTRDSSELTRRVYKFPTLRAHAWALHWAGQPEMAVPLGFVAKQSSWLQPCAKLGRSNAAPLQGKRPCCLTRKIVS